MRTDPKAEALVLTRREMMHKTGVAAAALAAGMLTIPAVSSRMAWAQGSGLSQKIKDALNFALTLEYLEDEFYKAGLAAPGLIPAGDRVVFRQIGKHETAHVDLLKSALGVDAVAKPTFDFTGGGAFPDALTNYATFLALSQGFEDTGVRAYKGQAAELMADNAILTIALQIHSVEARHASEVRRLRSQKGWITGTNTDVSALAAVYAGEGNTTQAGVNLGSSAAVSEAFDEPLTKAQVLAIADPFIV